MGVATGCGCKEVYRFPLLIPTPLVSVLFTAASLLFVHKKNVFRSFITIREIAWYCTPDVEYGGVYFTEQKILPFVWYLYIYIYAYIRACYSGMIFFYCIYQARRNRSGRSGHGPTKILAKHTFFCGVFAVLVLNWIGESYNSIVPSECSAFCTCSRQVYNSHVRSMRMR